MRAAGNGARGRAGGSRGSSRTPFRGAPIIKLILRGRSPPLYSAVTCASTGLSPAALRPDRDSAGPAPTVAADRGGSAHDDVQPCGSQSWGRGLVTAAACGARLRPRARFRETGNAAGARKGMPGTHTVSVPTAPGDEALSSSRPAAEAQRGWVTWPESRSRDSGPGSQL